MIRTIAAMSSALHTQNVTYEVSRFPTDILRMRNDNNNKSLLSKNKTSQKPKKAARSARKCEKLNRKVTSIKIELKFVVYLYNGAEAR